VIPFDLVVRHARIATAADTFDADIGIAGGRIVALAQGLPAAPREIDAAARVVTPGGVDAHCHLDQPMPPPARMADDFDSGTRSAACGGTTTVIPFAAQKKGHSLRAAVDDYHRRAKGKAHVDYAFHLIVSDPTPEVLTEELPALIAEGYTSFKIYMTYNDLKLGDGEILDVLAVAREHGAMAMIHAENADCIEWLTKRLEAAGRTAPRFHAHARPMLVEREATHRAIALAELVDVPILIVHVSGREAVEQIRWARAHGLSIFGETCPQYLFLTAADLGIDDGYVGAKCVCSPPPRDKSNQEVIWRGLALDQHRPRMGVEARRGAAGRLEALGQPLDAVGVLGVDHRHRTVLARDGQHIEDLAVVELQVVVGHVDLERRVALGDQRRQFFVEHRRRRIADDQVEGVVHVRPALGAAVVVVDRSAQ